MTRKRKKKQLKISKVLSLKLKKSLVIRSKKLKFQAVLVSRLHA